MILVPPDFLDLDEIDLDLSTLVDPVAPPTDFATLVREVRRHLHRNPELGFEEYETSAFLCDVLQRRGLGEPIRIAHTGLFLDIVGEHDGPTIAYRADMDALPTQDAKSVAYASQRPGVAHLCGHDAHMAIAVGTALILHQNRDRLHGTVRMVFQPNEEGIPGGANEMIREGVLHGVQSIYAVHVDPTLEAGRYGLLAGAITSAADQFHVVIEGSSTGHSARPHQTIDTIWIATQVAQALFQLPGRMTDARHPCVLAICRFHAGDAYNVIPNRVEFGGSFRTTDPQERSTMGRYIRRAAEELATLYGAIVHVEIRPGAPPVNNDPRLVKHLESVLRSRWGEDAIFHIPHPSMGSEDFSHYLEEIPGMMLRAGTRGSPTQAHPLHDARFDLNESALAPTSVLMAHVLSSHLEKGLLT